MLRLLACVNGESRVYLAGHKDIFTGEIVGYAMGARMSKSLVTQSLFRAVAAKRPAKGLIHHSDRGSQYCPREYRKILDQFGIKASMSRKGNVRVTENNPHATGSILLLDVVPNYAQFDH